MSQDAKKVCRICNTEKEITDFNKDSSKKDGHRNECRECSRLLDKEKTIKFKDKIKERRKNYYINNKEQVTTRVLSYYNRVGKEKEKERNKKLEKELFNLLGNQCKLCGDTNNLAIDHINGGGTKERKKLSKWGLIRKILKKENDINNYQLLCHNCNGKKYIISKNESIKNKEIIGKEKICKTCNEKYDVAYFHKHNGYEDLLYYECVFCLDKRRKEIKSRVMELFGSKCSMCGENDINKLNIDHIIPIGKNRKHHGINTYRKILNKSLDEKKFQVLCFNCNQEKGGDNKTDESYYLSDLLEIKKEKHELNDFNFKDCSFRRIDKDGYGFFHTHHYDGYGRSSKVEYGVYLDNELIAAVKFCSQGRQGTANQIGYTSDDILELDRFCIHPNRHKPNFGSFIMSKMIKMVKNDFKEIKCLVSFSDPAHGHDGALYKSSNWEFVGKTSKSYYYEKETGEIIKKKTFYNWIKSRGLNKEKTELEVANELNIKRIKVPAKFKFKYIIR